MSSRLLLERVALRGYRALADVDLALGPLNVIIGPNGVGKSSLLDALRLIGDAIGGRESLGRLLSARGGLGRVLTLGKRTSLEAELFVRADGSLLQYRAEIATAGIGFVINEESLRQDDGVPLFELGAPSPAGDGLLLAQLTTRGAPPLLERLRVALGDVHYHEAIPVSSAAPVRRPQTLEPTSLLVTPGSHDLFSVLYQMRHEAPASYERVLDALRVAFPGLERLEFPVVAGGQVMLAWYHSAYEGRPFYANELSAGTLRFLHLATLLLTPRSPTLIMIDEPEESMHPELIRLLAELLLEASERTQLLVATQSPALLRWLKPEHIIVADMQDGGCTLTPASSMNLDAWLKDYSLDSLWQMGHLGGRP